MAATFGFFKSPDITAGDGGGGADDDSFGCTGEMDVGVTEDEVDGAAAADVLRFTELG